MTHKIKCGICEKRIPIEQTIPFGIWQALCQNCYLRQIFLKNKSKRKNEIKL